MRLFFHSVGVSPMIMSQDVDRFTASRDAVLSATRDQFYQHPRIQFYRHPGMQFYQHSRELDCLKPLCGVCYW